MISFSFLFLWVIDAIFMFLLFLCFNFARQHSNVFWQRIAVPSPLLFVRSFLSIVYPLIIISVCFLFNLVSLRNIMCGLCFFAKRFDRAELDFNSKRDENGVKKR